MITIFWSALFFLLYPLIIYPITLKIISLFYPTNEVTFDESYTPFITVVISAFNEEKVIRKKLKNVFKSNYPKERLSVIVVSDQSTDSTDEIVEEFINSNPYISASLIVAPERAGKTSAQNYAVKKINDESEIIVFTDANSFLREDSIRILVNRFRDRSIAYVSGKLIYCDSSKSATHESENHYWNLDLKIREWESAISSTVGGNGALYAIRKTNYYDLPALLSHDGFMPSRVVINGFKAKFEPRALAVEKTSSTITDEFSRKVRMQRGQPWKKYYDFSKFNIFKYGWFSYFYIGHKYLKYQLYFLHITVLILNFLILEYGKFFLFLMLCQLLFYCLSLVGFITKTKIKLFFFPFYYCMTIYAQFVAVVTTLTGRSKSIWNTDSSNR